MNMGTICEAINAQNKTTRSALQWIAIEFEFGSWEIANTVWMKACKEDGANPTMRKNEPIE